MVRTVRLLFVSWMILAALGPMAAVTVAAGQPLPPQAKVRGKTTAEWSFLQSEWLISTGLGGQEGLPDVVNKMQFLPGPFFPGAVEFDVVTSPGTGLVLPAVFAFGERYADGSADDPVALAEIIDIIFNETELEVTLDGDVLFSGTPAELGGRAYGFDSPLYFDEPIVYETPIDRGGPFPAVAALWTFGVGAVYHPLSPGEHTIVVVQNGPIFGDFNATYHISVQRPGAGASAVPEPSSLLLVVLSGSLLFARRSRAK